MALFMLILMVCVGIFWVFEFVDFMKMTSDEFANEHDRFIWGAAFVLVFPATPFAFFLWRMMYEPKRDTPVSAVDFGVPDEEGNGEGIDFSEV